MGKKIKKPALAKLGITFLVLSILLLIYSMFATFSVVAIVVYYMVIVLAILLTFFTIFINEQFKKFIAGGEAFTQFCMAIQKTAPYFLAAVIVLSTGSLLSFIFTKKYSGKHAGIVISSIVLGLAIITLVLNLVGVGKIGPTA